MLVTQEDDQAECGQTELIICTILTTRSADMFPTTLHVTLLVQEINEMLHFQVAQSYQTQQAWIRRFTAQTTCKYQG